MAIGIDATAGDMFDVERTLRTVVPDLALRAAGNALYRGANIIFNESQLEVPIKKAILKGTGQIVGPIYTDNDVSVLIGYGTGGAEDYAVVQHENLEFHHTHGKAKYLSDPMNRWAPSAEGAVASEVEGAL